MAEQSDPANEPGAGRETRRDFLFIATGAMAAAGTAAAVWPLIASMNPATDTLEAATTEVDISPIEVGQRITVIWRGRPVFISHRSPEEIALAKADDGADLPDPEADSARVQCEKWLIVIGICTHLGCIPKGQRSAQPRGQWRGWFCPCHGSHYDTSGRIRKGPAPRNLDVPRYDFLEGGVVRIA